MSIRKERQQFICLYLSRYKCVFKRLYVNMDTCYVRHNDFIECRWNLWLWRTVPVFQIVLGTLGNAFNIIILLRKRLQTHSSTVYLVLLAVADLGTLWTWTFNGILVQGFGRNLRASSQFSCKIITYLTSIAGGYSMWLIVLLSIERMVLVRFPVFSRSNITRRSAVVTAVACFGAIAILHSYALFKYELKYIAMNRDNETFHYRFCELPSNEKTFPMLLVFFFSLIPITLLLIANIVIIVTIVVQRRRFCTVNPAERIQKHNTNKKTRSSTRTIVVISAVFIFTTFPIIFNKAFSTPPVSDKDLARKILFESIFIFLIYFNYSLNFVLYCLGGTVFREEFFTFVKESKHKVSSFF